MPPDDRINLKRLHGEGPRLHLPEGYRRARVRGFNIAYKRLGQGEPMLLIHGITTYSFIWRGLEPLLSKDFDMIMPDLLGCGYSDKPFDTDYSIKAQSEMIAEFLGRLGLQKVHLVTHDIGGGIGQILAVSHPEMISELVLINTVAYDFWPVQPIITMRIPIIRQLAMAVLDRGMFRAIIRRGLYHKDRLDDELMGLFLRPLRDREGRQGFLHLARCLNNRQLIEISDDLKKLEIPVLIIRGDADPYLKADISKKLHEEMKNSRLEIIETGGHFLQIDEPELLADLITKFVKQR